MGQLSSHRQEAHFILSGYAWIIPIGLAVFLTIISQFNYLLFHTLAELFAIIVAVMMCVVAWQMYPFTRNNYLMYLGAGYFWVGMMDLVHTLTFKGILIYNAIDPGMTIQFWIVARFIEAFLLLTSPWFLNARLNYRVAFGAYAVLSVFGYVLVYSGSMPSMYLIGEGLTNAKVFSEYVIISILAGAIVYLWRQREFLDQRILKIMMVSIGLTMCSELAFTFYVEYSGIANLVGHILKLFSFWLIFMAMIRTTLQEPFTIMSRGANTYDAIPDATILVNRDGVIFQVNQAACALANMSKKELIGKHSHEYFHPNNIDSDDCVICKASLDGYHISNVELEDTERDLFLDYTLSPVVEGADVDGMVVVVRDITHRKQVEQKLEDLSELKNSIVENLPAILFVKTAKDHRYVEWNKAAEDLTGLSREEMLGKNDYDFFTEDEASFYVDMDKKVLSEGVLHDIPEEPIHTRFKGVRLLNTRKIPIFNQQGEASYLLGISQDITTKRETEEMLRRSQKMEAVGQLSGGIAHDFNNQLGIVTGYLEFLKVFVEGQEKQKGWVEHALKAANRCVELTRQLLLFSRSKPAGKMNIDINQSINDIEDIIEKSVTPEVKILYQLDPNLWQVSIDENELEDAVVNMIINSRDAMPDGGEITIRTSNIYLDNDFVIASPGMKTGEYSMLEIKDNGFGMSKDVIDHIFEPFFTTKPVGKGTGLGMSMVYSFVQRYEGSIKIDSSPGAGSSIKIYLPKATDEDYDTVTEIDNDRLMNMPRGSETVLIVDDEIDLLNLAGDYLESLGYKSIKASNGVEALDILKKYTIDIVFSDIVMPGGINGYELADQVREKYPGIKVLLSSGYTGKSTGTVYKAVYKELIVAKPYTRQDLAHRIRSVLDN